MGIWLPSRKKDKFTFKTNRGLSGHQISLKYSVSSFIGNQQGVYYVERVRLSIILRLEIDHQQTADGRCLVHDYLQNFPQNLKNPLCKAKTVSETVANSRCEAFI